MATRSRGRGALQSDSLRRCSYGTSEQSNYDLDLRDAKADDDDEVHDDDDDDGGVERN